MLDTASTYGPYTDSGAEESPATTQPAPEASTSPAPETVSTAPATAPTIAPPRSDQTLNNLPSAPPQSWASKTYHGILAALGGSHDTVLSRDPQTGAMVVTQHTAQPGEQWKRIISGALTGFAGAQAAGTQGPGGAMRGLAGGIQAGAAARERNYQQARNEADEDFKIQQQTATDNANRSMQAHQIAASEFQLMNMKKQADQADIDSLNTYNQVTQDGGPGTVDLGTFKNPGEIYKFAAQYKESHNIHAEGRVFMHGDYDANGNRIGVRAAFVTNDWLNSKTTRPYSFTIQQPGEDGELHNEKIEIPAGEKNSVLMPFISGMNAARNKNKIDEENADTRSQLADIKQQLADLRASGGDHEGTWSIQEDESGKPILFNSKTGATRDANGVEKPGMHAKNALQDLPPAAAGTFDPQYPPAQNFPPGTPGIVVKQIGKVPAKVSANADLARNIHENTDAAARIINTYGDSLLGPVGGRASQLSEWAGSDNPQLRELAQRISNIAKATVGIHGSRSKDLVNEEENRLFNNFKAGKNGALSALRANSDSAQTFLNSERNWQMYGSSTGPDRKLAITPQTTPPGIVPSSAVTPPAAATGKIVSLAAAKQLPQNKGKTDDQITADIKSHGHQVGP